MSNESSRKIPTTSQEMRQCITTLSLQGKPSGKIGRTLLLSAIHLRSG